MPDTSPISQIGNLLNKGITQFSAFFGRCGDGPVTIIFDGVDDGGVGRQEKVGAGGFSSFGFAIDVGEPSVSVRYGFSGVQVGETSNTRH